MGKQLPILHFKSRPQLTTAIFAVDHSLVVTARQALLARISSVAVDTAVFYDAIFLQTTTSCLPNHRSVGMWEQFSRTSIR